MSTIRFNSKTAFISALEGRRAFWRTFDERRKREHEAAEQAWLDSSRARLRRALELDYAGLKKSRSLYLEPTPDCPVLFEKQLDDLLSVIGYTQAQRFSVSREGTWANAHKLLTWDPDAKNTVC